MKVWDSKAGALVADLTEGCTGQIFLYWVRSEGTECVHISRGPIPSLDLDCIVWRRSGKSYISETRGTDVDAFLFLAERSRPGFVLATKIENENETREIQRPNIS